MSKKKQQTYIIVNEIHKTILLVFCYGIKASTIQTKLRPT